MRLTPQNLRRRLARGKPRPSDPGADRSGRRALPEFPSPFTQETTLDKRELERVQSYLRKLFQNQTFRVVARPRKDDSAEVYLGEEFIGVVFRDDEDGDLSYNFQMAILETDLE
jgi:hypothetical protein